MWTREIRYLSFNGSLMVDIGGGTHMPLKDGLINIYRFSNGANITFEPLTQTTQRTDSAGNFSFSSIPVLVEVQTIIPSTPPNTPTEVTRIQSLPNLAFCVSLDSEVVSVIGPKYTNFEEIYDERVIINTQWLSTHLERQQVSLSGSPSIQILIPEGNAAATQAAGIIFPPSTVPGKEFHFLRVGRVVRQEIGELGDTRPEYVGKAGYMRSSDTWTSFEPSFISNIIDAPFGATLHVGGQFGANLLNKEIYYSVSFGSYSGDPADPIATGSLVQILDPLYNKRYILPVPPVLPNGKWETLNLGPFDGTIADVEPPHDPGLIGTAIKVYKRPPLPNLLVEYWPFWDLIALWNSATSLYDLCILSLEAYEKIGGSDANPQLKKIDMTPSVNGHLPLLIDNSPPMPVFLPFNPATPAQKFNRAAAKFLGVSESIIAPTPLDVCNEFEVTPGDTDGNECLLVRYSVLDGSENPHQHIDHYELYARFTPKAVIADSPDSVYIALKPTFSGNNPTSQSYTPANPPIMSVSNFSSVVVPEAPDEWPPEKGDKDALSVPPYSTCPQYALEVGLNCWARTIDGWGHIFGYPHVSRHIIIRRH